MNTINAQIGDHLVTSRIGYTHHALYIGDGEVMHYLNDEGVTFDSLEAFAKGEEVWIREHSFRRYSREESVERAYSRFGDDNYNVVFNNCEHFVNWCIDGLHVSEQVNAACMTVAAPFIAKETAKRVAPTVVRSILSTTVPASTKVVAATTLTSGTATAGAMGLMGGTASALTSASTLLPITVVSVPIFKGAQRVIENYDICDNPLDVAIEFSKGAAECVSDVYDGVSNGVSYICEGVGNIFSSIFD